MLINTSAGPTVLSTLISKLKRYGEIKLYEIVSDDNLVKSLSLVLLEDDTIDININGLDVGDKPTSFRWSEYAEEHFEYLMFDSLFSVERNEALYSVVTNVGSILISKYCKQYTKSMVNANLIDAINEFTSNHSIVSDDLLNYVERIVVYAVFGLRLSLTLEYKRLCKAEVN